MIKVGYSIKRKLSDDNYGSYDVGAWAEAEIDAKECTIAMQGELAKMCQEKLGADIEKIKVSLAYAKIQKEGKA